MTTFNDGPAKGQHLMLRRAPVFLRVAHGTMPKPKGASAWDALDQLEDSPRQDEALYAYRIVGEPSRCHIRSATKGASGWYVMATYAVIEPQPTDADMRTNEAWARWVAIQAAKEGK